MPTELQQKFETAITKLQARISRHQERYVRAWYASTGVMAQFAVLVHWDEMQDGKYKHFVQIQYRQDRELRRRLEWMVNGGNVSYENVRKALDETR